VAEVCVIYFSSSSPGVSNVRPAGRVCPHTTFLCGLSRGLGISQCEKVKNSLLLRNIDGYVHKCTHEQYRTLSKRKSKELRKKK
jgi:hypothetical protein